MKSLVTRRKETEKAMLSCCRQNVSSFLDYDMDFITQINSHATPCSLPNNNIYHIGWMKKKNKRFKGGRQS